MNSQVLNFLFFSHVGNTYLLPLHQNNNLGWVSILGQYLHLLPSELCGNYMKCCCKKTKVSPAFSFACFFLSQVPNFPRTRYTHSTCHFNSVFSKKFSLNVFSVSFVGSSLMVFPLLLAYLLELFSPVFDITSDLSFNVCNLIFVNVYSVPCFYLIY